MASCRSVEPAEPIPAFRARPPCAPVLAGASRSRPAPPQSPSLAAALPADGRDPPLVRPTRPLEEAVVLADSEPTSGPFAVVEDGRVTTWCTGADERFAWRWFEQLGAQGVRVVLARLDGCVAVFRTPLPEDSDEVASKGKQRRPCLRCGKSFWSTNPGNRICRFCGIRNAGVIQGFGRAEED